MLELVSGGVALPDEAIVVRAGLLHPKDLRTNAQKTWKRMNVWGCSGYVAEPPMTVEALLEQLGPELMPNHQFRRALVGTLRGGGHDVYRSRGSHHVTIVVPGGPTDDLGAFEALSRLFDPAEPNPVRRPG